MEHPYLVEDGEIMAWTDDEDYALVIHHVAGLTIALKQDEMVALGRLIAEKVVAAMPDEDNFDEYDDARQLVASYEEGDRLHKEAIIVRLAHMGYQLQWTAGKTIPDVVRIMVRRAGRRA